MSEPLPIEILRTAVAEIHGDRRAGQEQMAQEVYDTLETGTHLLVQAGTGTGKSLGYLAGLLAHLHEHPKQRAVIATATLALQSQLMNKDIPTAIAAFTELTGAQMSYAVCKGRGNYGCLYRARSTGAEQMTLFDDYAPQASALGEEVVELRQWVEDEYLDGGSGDRDDAPPHTGAAWSQVSVSARECLGQKCPFLHDCFAERAQATARNSRLVVTNHALLAINAMGETQVLPEHQALVVDEAHELVSRVTSAASNQISPGVLDRIMRQCRAWLSEATLEAFQAAVFSFTAILNGEDLGEVSVSSPLYGALAELRDAAYRMLSALGDPNDDINLQLAVTALTEVYSVADLIADVDPMNVVWISEHMDGSRALVQAPLSVAEIIGEAVFSDRAAILTSATLTVGGDFTQIEAMVGLHGPAADTSVVRAIDVGSPFDYGRQGILYIAKHLPPPGRSGLSDAALAHIAELMLAAGGRTLGLFSSRKAAEQATEYVRDVLPGYPVLCQGEAQLPALTAEFIANEAVSLFGTISLWQGVDVPGATCTLVIIDRIPFPRPDDPLTQARSRAVAQAGGNGFMQISAGHAGLLLAQGSGRLIRSLEDRGVVAVLDSRLANARYGPFLRASMPPFWNTIDPTQALRALENLNAAGDGDDSN
ncbi:MAG: ATP-dependent DNA helicase [Propionibacteriaceae bacterium]|jgi:ATP-dependent DNA helicase DinG|nr:ATP-dependent DNA helicase [Propionibacteriaceae bacterium]